MQLNLNRILILVAVMLLSRCATSPPELPLISATNALNTSPSSGSIAVQKLKDQLKHFQPPSATELSQANFDFGDYHALVIGNNNYRFLPSLKTAINDAKKVAEILQSDYGFSTTLLIDATRHDILIRLNQFRKTLREKDNLLIYYAGHGWLDREVDRGYWIPVDAESDNNVNWISNTLITDELRAIKAKHVILIADSCYSGKLTRGLNINLRSAGYFEQLLLRKARTVMTSGGVEPVVDSGGGSYSIFAIHFIRALQENQGIIDGLQLFDKIRRPVMINSHQTPEYGDIHLSGHDGGDFIFVRKSR